eukprot:scaffold51485_cov21-Cyclotella_meneghiniana.AAC.1
MTYVRQQNRPANIWIPATRKPSEGNPLLRFRRHFQVLPVIAVSSLALMILLTEDTWDTYGKTRSESLTNSSTGQSLSTSLEVVTGSSPRTGAAATVVFSSAGASKVDAKRDDVLVMVALGDEKADACDIDVARMTEENFMMQRLISMRPRFAEVDGDETTREASKMMTNEVGTCKAFVKLHVPKA